MADRDAAIVLASGNLGLIYLMECPRRMYQEEIEERHPAAARRRCAGIRTSASCWFTRGRAARSCSGRGAPAGSTDDAVEGEDPLAPFPPRAADHLRRTDGFEHVADIMVNSFYDPDLEQGCAFEELISFHGGLGGPQTQPFILHPVELPMPAEPIVGAAAVHDLLMGWRRALHDGELASASAPAPAGGAGEHPRSTGGAGDRERKRPPAAAQPVVVVVAGGPRLCFSSSRG